MSVPRRDTQRNFNRLPHNSHHSASAKNHATRSSITNAYRAFIAILSAAFLVSCATLTQPVRAATPASEKQRTEADVQALVMQMSDEYIAGIAEATYLMSDDLRADPRGRMLIQSFLRNGVGAALDIGAGPNPNVALLDMLVLSSLQVWAFEKNWIKAGINLELAGDAIRRLKEAKEQTWQTGAQILTREQLDSVTQLIDAWIAANPNRTVVSLVRFDDFTDSRRLPNANQRETAHALLVNLDDVTESVDQARLLGERALWFAGRYPYVLGEQSELTFYRIADQPEFKNAVALMKSLEQMSETLPAEIASQRESFFEALRVERDASLKQARSELSTTLDDAIEKALAGIRDESTTIFTALDARNESLMKTVHELRETIEASTLLSKEMTATASAFDQILMRFQNNPGEPGEPIRIADIRDAAKETGEAAQRLTTLLERSNTILASEEWNKRLVEIDLATEAWADKLFWRGLLLVVVLLVGIALIRLIPRRPA